jgi:hypothetical protein
MNEFPRLYTFARKTKVSLAQYMDNTNIHHNFHTFISHATLELQQFKPNHTTHTTKTNKKKMYGLISGATGNTRQANSTPSTSK